MKVLTSAVKLLATSAAVAALASCGGGGGGGGGGGSAPVIPSTSLMLTSANAQNVGGDATLAAVGSLDAVGTTAAADTQSNVLPRTHVLSRFLTQQIDRLNLESPSTIAAAATTMCANGGTVSIDSTSMTSAMLTFTNCSEVVGESINGSIAVSNFTGTAGNFSESVVFNLTFSEPGFGTTTFSGSFSISVLTSGNVTTITLTSGSSGEIISTHGTNTQRLSNFTLVSAFDSGTGVTTDTVTFTYASTRIGGSVTVATITPFETLGGKVFPHVGALLITGASGSKIRVTVLGDETLLTPQVQIEIDADGVGGFETTLTKNWSDLTA